MCNTGESSTQIHTDAYMPARTHTHMYAHTYIHIHIHTHTHTHTHTLTSGATSFQTGTTWFGPLYHWAELVWVGL